MTRIIGVHGVGNALAGMTSAQAADQLSQRWAQRLGAASGDLRVVYYAHHLSPPGRQGAMIDDPARLDPESQAMVLAWVAQLGAPQEVAQGRVTTPVRQALSWVADRFGLNHDLVHRFVARFFGKVTAYLRHGDRRAAARYLASPPPTPISPLPAPPPQRLTCPPSWAQQPSARSNAWTRHPFARTPASSCGR